MKRFLLILACLILCLSACAMAETDDGIISIRVFETTDVHGYLMDSSSANEANFSYRMAYLATVFNNARNDEAYDDVILLDGGDIYQGTPVSNLLYGDALRAAYDYMGYDAVALGNHEFDWDVTTYAADDQGTMPAYVVGDYAGDSDIPVLTSSIYYAGTDEHISFAKQYVILEKAGLKVCVIGYSPDWSKDIMAAKIAPYTIDGDMTNLAARVAEICAEENPDITIIASHCEPMSIAEAMDPALVDLVVGGHTHQNNAGVASNGIPYMQSGTQAKTYAAATINVNTADGSVSVDMPEIVSITGDKQALLDTGDNAMLDPDVLAISKAAWAAVADEMSQVLGYVDTSITRRGGDVNIAGNWITSLVLEATSEYGTVVAFYNAGGIRCELTLNEGETTRDITVGDMYTISPFGNKLYIYDITGAELKQQVLNGFKNGNYGDQFTGMTVTYTKVEIPSENSEGSAPAGQPGGQQGGQPGGMGPRAEYSYTIESIVLSDGTVVDINDDTVTYRVVNNEYCATLGGSIFENKTPILSDAECPIDNLAMIEVLAKIGAENGGYIPVDTASHCIDVTPAAAE